MKLGIWGWLFSEFQLPPYYSPPRAPTTVLAFIFAICPSFWAHKRSVSNLFPLVSETNKQTNNNPWLSFPWQIGPPVVQHPDSSFICGSKLQAEFHSRVSWSIYLNQIHASLILLILRFSLNHLALWCSNYLPIKLWATPYLLEVFSCHHGLNYVLLLCEFISLHVSNTFCLD